MAEAWRLKECVKDLDISCYVPETSVSSNTKVEKPAIERLSDNTTPCNQKRKRRGRVVRKRSKASRKEETNNCSGMPSNIQFDDENKFYSVSCGLCKRNVIKGFTQVNNTTAMHVTFSNMLSTFGADWEMVANVLGLTGPNGRHFCPFCEIMLSNINEGVPHSPVLFPKYTNMGPISPELYENCMLKICAT